MKTNFTTKNRILMAFALLAVAFFSCKDNEEIPVVDVSGSYAFTSATLIDGDVDVDGAQNLVITNGMALVGKAGDIDVSSGDDTYTTPAVNAILAGASPCTLTQSKYKIDLIEDGKKVAFVCTSEANTSENIGTYALLDNDKTLSMDVNVDFSPVPINISITDLVITDATLKGTVKRFPMIKMAGPDIGVDNLVYISTSVTLTKI